jgi:hypothetical protein
MGTPSGHRRPISAPVWAELMRTRTQTTPDAAIQYIQELGESGEI